MKNKKKPLINKVKAHDGNEVNLDDVIIMSRTINENEHSTDICANANPVDLLYSVNKTIYTVGFYLVQSGIIDKSEIIDLLEKVSTDALIDLGREFHDNGKH